MVRNSECSSLKRAYDWRTQTGSVITRPMGEAPSAAGRPRSKYRLLSSRSTTFGNISSVGSRFSRRGPDSLIGSNLTESPLSGLPKTPFSSTGQRNIFCFTAQARRCCIDRLSPPYLSDLAKAPLEFPISEGETRARRRRVSVRVYSSPSRRAFCAERARAWRGPSDSLERLC